MPQHNPRTEEQPVVFRTTKSTNLIMMIGIVGIAVLTTAIPGTSSPYSGQSDSRNGAIAQDSASSPRAEMTITGQLEDSSPTLAGGSSPYNIHTFEGKAGEQIAILLGSQAFDAYVFVLGVDGRKIAEDDDSGGGSSALVVITLPEDGTYTVLTTAYAREARGLYQLQWRSATTADQALVQAGKLVQEIDQLKEQGHYAEAIPLAEQVLDLRRHVWGANHPDVATSLNNLAYLYDAQGRYGEAEPLYQQALKIRQEALGANHPVVSTSLNNLAYLYYEQGRYSEAEPLFQQALKIRQEALGENHPDVASTLNNLAALYYEQGRHSEAEPLYQQALKILKEALGENHHNVASTLNNLAALYKAQGRYSETELFYQQALKIQQEALGTNHPNVASTLHNLAVLYDEQGRYSEAEPLFQQALKIQQEALGASHPAVAISLSSIASLYDSHGRYSEAEPLFQQALKIQQEALGTNHPDVAQSLNNLAALYKAQGRYSEAEPLFQQALKIRQEALGANHPDVAQSLSNLATLYEAQGRYSEAEPLFQQALKIRQEALGASHPDVSAILNNLAYLYYEQGRYSEAESSYQQALKILKDSLGMNHSNVASTLNNLALVYNAQGRYSEAEPLFQQALKIQQEALGASHPSVASTLNNLALVYDAQGHYSEAELFYQQSLKILKDTLGMNHPNLSSTLNNLALLNWAQGQMQPALYLLQQGLSIQEVNLDRNLIGGSESNKRDYLKTFNGTTDIILTLNLQALPQNTTATQLALKTVLQRKGRLLDLFTTSQQTLRNQLDFDSQNLLDQLNQVRTQISTLYYNRSETLASEQYQQQLKDLNSQSQQLEDKLSRRSAAFRATTAPIDLSTLQSLLPADGVLVEFSRYQVVAPKAARDKRFGDSHYAAYVLAADGKITGIDLGAATIVDSLIADLSAAMGNPSVRVEQVKEAARALDAVLMAPIRSHLGNQKHLLISPDGPLNLIPFEALVDENNQYLVENHTFTYLTSGRDLLRLQAQSQSQQPPLLVANPFFGNRSNQVNNSVPSNDLRQRVLEPLDGTSAEAEAIASQLPEAQFWQGNQATETVVKQANRPRILHIATHGFFSSTNSQNAVPTENPLLGSGLFLAGFRNTPQAGTEDGILTALEVSNLNLLGTQMVALSACDTGQGDLSVGEGVYGLRRSLVLAGSESQVISLWRVRDNSTKDLMVSYYQKLLQGKGRSESLREAQLTMLKDEQTAHPYYWAPFIQSGDWRPLH
jgi:tetratricopeptide (TPR) repeat protein